MAIAILYTQYDFETFLWQHAHIKKLLAAMHYDYLGNLHLYNTVL